MEEYYRLRYTTDRIYLLDYNRTMNSILQEESDIYVNDKIVIGIADENLPIYESEDGNIFAFVVQDRLYSYNVTTNKMTVVFGFYKDEYTDARKMDTNHDIRVLNIDEGGNIQFAVTWTEAATKVKWAYRSTITTVATTRWKKSCIFPITATTVS